MTHPAAIPSQSPDELRAEISQYRIYRNALLAFLGVVAFAALAAVVSTTLAYRAYTSTLVITLWCGIPVVRATEQQSPGGAA